MVKVEIIKNKAGEILKTKDGVELKDYKLEAGDVFIPVHNSLLERSNPIEEKDKNGKIIKKTITNYKLKVLVKDYNDEKPVFISLTPAQARTMNKKIAEGILINQNLFNAYTYEDKEGNEWVGVGIKGKMTPNKTFDDFKEELDDSKVEPKEESKEESKEEKKDE